MEYRQSECQNSLNEIFELRLKALVCPLYKIGHKSLEVVLFLVFSMVRILGKSSLKIDVKINTYD